MLKPIVVPSRPLAIVDPAEIRQRLLMLSPTLDPDLFYEVLLRGYEARLEITDAFPPTAAGLQQWMYTVAALREELIRRGWQMRNYKNCPWAITADESLLFGVVTGDFDTGREHGRPSNQAEKGSVLEAAIQQNQLFSNEDLSTGSQMWVLMYHLERGVNGDKELRAELSMPSMFDRGKIVDWSERIIFPPISMDDLHNSPGDDIAPPASPIDVPVERRHAG